MKNKNFVVFAAVVVLAAVFALAAMMYKMQQNEAANQVAAEHAQSLVRPYSPTFGPADAPVTLVEFFDPACEACGAFYPIVKQILRQHEGKIRLVLRYAAFHQGSDKVVLMLEAARAQNMYVEALQTMLMTQAQWASHHDPKPDLLWQLLAQAGLDIDRLAQDMQRPEFAQHLAQDMADVQTLGVQKTPSFFVNGEPLTTFGVQPLKQLIAKHLNDAK